MFPNILGMSQSQLTLTPSFFRGVGLNHQPVTVVVSVSQFIWVNHSDLIASSLECQWIGLRENSQESPILNGEIHGFLQIFP